MTNQTNPKSFILFQEYKQNISLLSQSQKGDLLDAIFAYNEGEKITLEPVVEMAFSFIKSDLDRNREKYQNIVERNKINGLRGGRPKTQENPVGYLGTQRNPKNLDNGNDNKDDNGNKDVNKKESKKKSFTKPTLQDVQDYCKERNNNVDAKKFFDYYSAGDWKDAKGNQVKNWKQKLLTWESKSQNQGTSQNDSPFASYAHLRSK